MSRDKPKSNRPPENEVDDHAATIPNAGGAGRVKFDDRGNAVWEWSIETGAFGTQATNERMRRLDNPTLAIADDAPTPVEGVKANPMGTKKGYDPYDSGKLAKAQAPRKKDLRRLSEWLKLKKQASANKDNDKG